MKKLTLVLCAICLLLPVITMADQPCSPCLAGMLEEGILTEAQLQALMAGDWNNEEIQTLITEHQEITPSQNIYAYICYYIAYEAIIEALNCLRYFNISLYSCESVIFWSIAYSLLCT